METVVTTDFKALQGEITALGERVAKLAADGTNSGTREAQNLAIRRTGLQSEMRSYNREAQFFPLWKPIDFERTAYSWSANDPDATFNDLAT